MLPVSVGVKLCYLFLHLPAPKLSLGKNTFRYSGSVLFNKLPRTLKGATSLSKFKNLLKQYVLY